ncbi:MAG TPA: MFS transporter, partial [Pyrinomonadaceae bacterium]
EPVESVSPTERIVGAMRAGVRYVRHDPSLHAVFVRTGVYVSCASALWAMMPLIARKQLGLGALGYGILLGGLGAGAIAAAFLLPGLRRRFSINTIIIGGTITFAAGIVVLAKVRAFPLLFVAMIAAGIAWMSLMSSFNVSVQTIVPSWVRARVLAIYMLVFFGSMALGSAVWGVVATHIGLSEALLCAAGAMIVGLGAAYFFPLQSRGGLDLEPSLHWADPLYVNEPHPKAGPILVTVEYEIEPERAADFVKAMREIKRILRRYGALRWGLFADPARPGHYLETFLVESWAEHMRQHARVTNEDRRAQELSRSFHIGAAPPVVTHLVAQDISKRDNGGNLEQPILDENDE